MLVFEDGHIEGTVGGGEIENRVIQEALEAIKDGQTRRRSYSMVDPGRGDPGICGGTVEVYVEPVLPPAQVVVIGAGHVGKAVVHLAKWLGFQVILSDDREEFCNPAAVPGADEYLAIPMEKLPEQLNFHSQCYLVLATRGMVVDVPGLPALLETPAAYIGVIGSRRRWTMTRKTLLQEGVSDEKISRVHSPIGLALGAETPEEIAVSIMAEILSLRSKSSGESLKYK